MCSLTWPRPLQAAHVDGLPSAGPRPLRALQLLLQPLQLKQQRALLCAQSLQHGLLLDQRLRQLVEAVLQLRLAAAAQSLIGQLEERRTHGDGRELKLTESELTS